MHIPDNYLSPSTCAVMGAAMVPVWAIAAAKIKKEISAKKIPLLGISAAFSFLVMMLNVPLPGGTTGHAVGSVLIAILLGPFSACITVTIALLIQALFFSDGGILAFGANCFNMAFIMPFTGFFIFKLLNNLFKSDKAKYVSAFIASYIALNIAALFTAIEFGIQPLLFKDATGMPLYSPYPLSVSIPAMMIPHLLVAGIIEGIITVGVYAYVAKMSPGILYEEKETKALPLYLLILGIIIITPLGLLAPGTAWGEWGIEEIEKLVNFIPEGMKNGFNFNSIMPDYTIPFVNNEYIGYIIAAIAGAGLLLIVFKIIAELLKKRYAIKKEESKK
jgi:cobalt/nickel transport system permease protein